MKNLIQFSFITFTICTVGCSVLESENHLDPIESKIIFSITYDSTNIIPDHSGFVLLLKTEKIYSCSNFKVKSTVAIKNGQISVQFFGIERDEICLTALGPATSRKSINIYPGDFSLNFNYMKKTDKYTLKIDDLNISVQEVDTSFTSYQKYNFDF